MVNVSDNREVTYVGLHGAILTYKPDVERLRDRSKYPIICFAPTDMISVEKQPRQQDLAAIDRTIDADLAALKHIDPTDPIVMYLHDIGKTPLLTREKEVNLAMRIEKGEQARIHLAIHAGSITPEDRLRTQGVIHDAQQATNNLIEANRRLVVSVAKKYRHRDVPILDLIQEGNIGLVRAVKKYDYRLGHKFSTFATWWIRQAVTRFIAEQGRTIRIPVHASDQLRAIHMVQYRLFQQLNSEPSAEEISAELPKIPLNKVKFLLEENKKKPLSLDAPIDKDEGSSLGEMTANPNQESTQDRATDDMRRELVQHVLLHDLPYREARVLRLLYGLEDGAAMTLEEIGQKMGITRERVRQIKQGALQRLRRSQYRQILEQYV